MTPLADLIRSMAADGCSIDTIANAVEAAENHAQGVTDRNARNVTNNALRQARWRDRQKAKTVTNNVTNNVTTGETIEGVNLTSPDKKEKKESISRVGVTPSRFPDFKASYPRRDGQYDWSKAEKRFNHIVGKGVAPDEIIGGARHYSQEQERLGKVGTEYVKMPVTWLNAEGWKDVQEEGGSNGSWDERIAAALRKQTAAGHHG